MKVEVELKRVDSQGRLILPSDWRGSQLAGTNEVYVIKREGSLKIVPKKKPDLKKFYDRVNVGVGAIGDWAAFETAHAEKTRRRSFWIRTCSSTRSTDQGDTLANRRSR